MKNKTPKSLAKAAVALVSAIGLASSSAWAQNPWQGQVNAELERASEALGLLGYQQAGTALSGDLTEGGTTDLSVTLEEGNLYAITAACDADCGDIDLTLYSGNDEVIDSDVETDDYPLVQVVVTQTGVFRVEVTMANCSAPTCFYGVGTFSGGEGGVRDSVRGMW